MREEGDEDGGVQLKGRRGGTSGLSSHSLRSYARLFSHLLMAPKKLTEREKELWPRVPTFRRRQPIKNVAGRMERSGTGIQGVEKGMGWMAEGERNYYVLDQTGQPSIWGVVQ